MGKRVNLPEASASKVDEIECLRQIAEKLPEGLYLSSLFSTGLVEWFTQQVKIDWSCDIMAHAENLRVQLWKSEGRNGTLRQQIEADKRQSARVERDIEWTEKDWTTRTEKLEKQIAYLKLQGDTVADRLNDRQVELYDLRVELFKREDTIKELKTQLQGIKQETRRGEW